MAPTPIPPTSTALNSSTASTNAHPPTLSLASMLKDLSSLIYSIGLPKTKSAKSCTILLENLHKARNLITSAVDAHEQQQNAPPQISSIIEQLNAISNHIGLSTKATPPSPTKPIHQDSKLHITLLQTDRNNPVLPTYTNDDLVCDATAACLNSDCEIKNIPDPDDPENPDAMERIPPNIRAAGRHRSGDIWFQCATEEDRSFLIQNASKWIPQFSNSLKLSIPTYPIVIHGFPTNFDPSRDSEDITALLSCNSDLIIHPSNLQHAEFISRKNLDTIRTTKTHSSLILYFTDLTAANNCISKQIVYHGDLYQTAKFIRRPPQCYNCHRYGHFARDCRSPTTCGLCSGAHLTRDCHCEQPTCTDTKSCRRPPLKCSLCSEAHAVTSMKCLHRQMMLKRFKTKISTIGRYF